MSGQQIQLPTGKMKPSGGGMPLAGYAVRRSPGCRLVLLDLDTGRFKNGIVAAVPVKITKNGNGDDQGADHERFQVNLLR